MASHRLFRLSTSGQWEVWLDSLSGRFLTSEEAPFGLPWDDLIEDLIFVGSSRCSIGIDLGWYPDRSTDGEFRIEMVDLKNLAATYARPLRKHATRSIWIAKQIMEEWMSESERTIAEPSPAPNSGPGTHLGNLNAAEGPPSVSNICESTRPVVIIDSSQFSDLAGFAKHFSKVALRDRHRWNGNLDAFNDILRGGFGTPEGGFTMVWRNHLKSRRDLSQTFDTLLDIIRTHGPGGEEAEDQVDLRLE